jgi:hypothetical protein
MVCDEVLSRQFFLANPNIAAPSAELTAVR